MAESQFRKKHDVLSEKQTKKKKNRKRKKKEDARGYFLSEYLPHLSCVSLDMPLPGPLW
jgi:hypothetical protein